MAKLIYFYGWWQWLQWLQVSRYCQYLPSIYFTVYMSAVHMASHRPPLEVLTINIYLFIYHFLCLPPWRPPLSCLIMWLILNFIWVWTCPEYRAAQATCRYNSPSQRTKQIPIDNKRHAGPVLHYLHIYC